MTAPTARKGKRPARRPTRVDASFLDNAALSYLNRFDASAARLRQVLLRRARAEMERGAPEPPSANELVELVDGLLSRYRASSLVDDTRFARNLADALRRRGVSRRGILAKLTAKGIDAQTAQDVVGSVDESRDAELEAARALARRRRLGFHRPESERRARRQKDLAVLARAGFGYDVAVRALGEGPGDDEF